MWVKLTGVLHGRGSETNLCDYFLYSDVVRSEDMWEDEAKSWVESTNEFRCFADCNDIARYECNYELNVVPPDDVRNRKIKEHERIIEHSVQMLRVLKGQDV